MRLGPGQIIVGETLGYTRKLLTAGATLPHIDLIGMGALVAPPSPVRDRVHPSPGERELTNSARAGHSQH